jgi:hypothetical protein
MTPPPFDRRRAEDVFRVVEEDVFPRLDSIDTKISSLEHGVQKLMVEGCAHREGDLRRTQSVEEGMSRIFEKIDDLGEKLGIHQVDVTKQVGGIRVWVLTSVVVLLVSLLVYFVKDYVRDIEQHVGKQPAAVSTPK